jgi:hypothetical protein
MVVCFGLHDGYQLARFPIGLLTENSPRVDVWALLATGCWSKAPSSS